MAPALTTPSPHAPPLHVSAWLNTPRPLALDDFRGRVLVLEAFQMLCPGCVAHGLPQAQRVARLFAPSDVAVVGLHTVFEHHEAQGSVAALTAFAHEYRLDFPIGIDAQALGGGPRTMRAYEMRGTPTLVVVDRAGRRRLQAFGPVDDLWLGAQLGALVAEATPLSLDGPSGSPDPGDPDDAGCDAEGCPAPPHVPHDGPREDRAPGTQLSV